MDWKGAKELYRLESWSEGYFNCNSQGNLCARIPSENLEIDIKKVVDKAIQSGLDAPMVIRFHDIIKDRIEKLNQAFIEILEREKYPAKYCGVYPIKVNQMREVLEEVVLAGESYNYGLEAGSKAELLAVMAYGRCKDSLVIVNGFKDEEFIELALLSSMIGHNVIIVVESLQELDKIIEVSKKVGVEPKIGFRIRVSSQGSSRWSKSSGEFSKFGLGICDIINGWHKLQDAELKNSFKLIHFHLGSQVSSIQSFAEAIKEVSRIYCEFRKLGADIQYVDIGGGLAIDYDGTQSTEYSSRNYNLEEYVTLVARTIKDICEDSSEPCPSIVTESGRYLSAHHSCIVTKVLDCISSGHRLNHEVTEEGEYSLYHKIEELYINIQADNARQCFHEISALKDQALASFKLGLLGLQERALIENKYWEVVEKINTFAQDSKELIEDLSAVPKVLKKQYLCNFSVFQSAADSWAIDQVLPILPIHKLNEQPTELVTIADITCDSDGRIDKFVGETEQEEGVWMHKIQNNEDYYVGLFLTGAYQDVMGDMHNLFGRLNEVHVFADKDLEDGFYIEEMILGSSKEDVLETMQYDAKVLAEKISTQLEKQTLKGELSRRSAKNILDKYIFSLQEYTYLKD